MRVLIRAWSSPRLSVPERAWIGMGGSMMLVLYLVERL